jgi:cytochrome P450
MAEYAEQLMFTWRDGEERDIHEEMMQLALRIVGKTLFDADVTHDAKEVGETLDILLRIAANFGRTVLIPLWVPTPRNLRAKLGIKRLEKVIYRIIENRRASGRDSGDLLSILLQAQDEDGTRMNDRQLRDETITLFLAGHETTANTLSWTWWLLAQNSAVEKKFHEELDGDARWFDAPLDFRPERWENGLAKQLPRFAYFPFGGGPRQCIGNTFALMEASVVLAAIGQKFRFQLVPGHAVIPLASITLRPKNGIQVRLEARK